MGYGICSSNTDACTGVFRWYFANLSPPSPTRALWFVLPQQFCAASLAFSLLNTLPQCMPAVPFIIAVLLGYFVLSLIGCDAQVGIALVMKQGRTPLDTHALTRFLKAQGKLAGFKQPTAVYIWHEAQLPRGATGKTLKKDIRKYYADVQAAGTRPRSKL